MQLSTMMDPATGTMDLPTGWGTAKYRHEESGEIISYFFNNKTGRSSLVPPPPHYYDDRHSNDSLAEDRNKKSEDLRVLFTPPPEELDSLEDDYIFDQLKKVTRAFIQMETRMTGAKDKDNAGSETPIQRMFDPDNMLKRDLVPKCVEAGILDVQSRMSLAQIKDAVSKSFIELHISEGATPHQSDSYVAQDQYKQSKGK